MCVCSGRGGGGGRGGERVLDNQLMPNWRLTNRLSAKQNKVCRGHVEHYRTV